MTICSFFILIFGGIVDYIYYIGAYIIAHFFRGLFLLYYNKQVFVNHPVADVNLRVWHVWPIIQAGLFLMVADYSIYMMFGIGRLFIENTWGIEVFSKFSFAMSLTLLMITCVNQIGLVLFPALKRLDQEKMKEIIIQYGKRVDLVLLVVFILYFIARKILILWLPQYEEAVFYFGVLVPLCVFDGRIAILLNPVLKAIRKEKQILYINISFFLLSNMCFFSLWMLEASVYYYCILFVMISFCRSFVSEYQMDKALALDFNKKGLLSKLVISSMFYVVLVGDVLM